MLDESKYLEMCDDIYIDESNRSVGNEKLVEMKLQNKSEVETDMFVNDNDEKRNDGDESKASTDIAPLLSSENDIKVEKALMKKATVNLEKSKKSDASSANEKIECRISISKGNRYNSKMTTPVKQCVINRLLAFIAILSSVLFLTAVAYILTLSGTSILSHLKAYQNRTQRETLQACFGEDLLPLKISSSRRLSNFYKNNDTEIIKVKINDNLILKFSTYGASLLSFHIRNKDGVFVNALIDSDDDSKLLMQNVGSVLGPLPFVNLGCLNSSIDSAFANNIWTLNTDANSIIFTDNFVINDTQELFAKVIYEILSNEIIIRFTARLISNGSSQIEIINNLPFSFDPLQTNFILNPRLHENCTSHVSDTEHNISAHTKNEPFCVYLKENTAIKYIGSLYSERSKVKLSFFTNQPWASIVTCSMNTSSNSSALFVRPHSVQVHSKNEKNYETNCNDTYINELRIKVSINSTED